VASDLVQGEAVILLGPDAGSLTDYSCFISEFVINDTRTVHVKAPSFGSPSIEEKAAADQAPMGPRRQSHVFPARGVSGFLAS
jgi:hypothetical protein